jgi:hypothetical protein
MSTRTGKTPPTSGGSKNINPSSGGTPSNITPASGGRYGLL